MYLAMKIYHYLIIVATLMMLSYGCDNRYQYVIENQDELIKLSLYQDITCNNGRNYYELKTYTPDYKLGFAE
jgi:hypothetical protein